MGRVAWGGKTTWEFNNACLSDSGLAIAANRPGVRCPYRRLRDYDRSPAVPVPGGEQPMMNGCRSFVDDLDQRPRQLHRCGHCFLASFHHRPSALPNWLTTCAKHWSADQTDLQRFFSRLAHEYARITRREPPRPPGGKDPASTQTTRRSGPRARLVPRIVIDSTLGPSNPVPKTRGSPRSFQVGRKGSTPLPAVILVERGIDHRHNTSADCCWQIGPVSDQTPQIAVAR